MRSLASVAVHEAGHLVMMLALGFPVESVSVVPDADSAGHVMPARAASGIADGPALTNAQTAAVYASAVMVSVAGAVAEELGGFTPAGCEGDHESARILADGVWELLNVHAYHWRHVARAETERYLRDNWSAVERVAAVLLMEKKMTGARVREVVGVLPSPDLRSLLGALAFWSQRASERASRAAVEVPAV